MSLTNTSYQYNKDVDKEAHRPCAFQGIRLDPLAFNFNGLVLICEEAPGYIR